ncbi:MAG: ABC transporter ATP-binding protein [Myxococcales bacterium]|nr:ABC transporter ATP-binding protein [Myxococcales bacterium]
MSGEDVLVVDDLRHRYGTTQALDGLSLRVRAGEIYGLVGPDGAGKTTAMRLFAGMMAPSGGSVAVLGESPLGASAALRQKIGYMPQQHSLYGDLSIDENLRFFARMFCLSRRDFAARREELLSITRLARFASRRADALSGGMYKKLALACALLPRPRLLLLDEPTNGVDPVSRRELWELLFTFAAAKGDDAMAVLITTAYMDEAARCHRVSLMRAGRLLVSGAPARLLAELEHPVLEMQSASINADEHWLTAQAGVVAVSVVGERLRAVVHPGALESLRERIAARGLTAATVQADFEDLYLARTVGEQREVAPTAEARA